MATLHPVHNPAREGMQKVRSKSSVPLYKRIVKAWPYYVVLLPTFVLLGVFGYYPAINGLYHAFYDWEPGFYANFTGLANFDYMLHDTLFWQSFKNIAQFFLFGITIAWALPIFAAELIMTLPDERWRFFFRSLLIVPFAFPAAVQILVWGFLYDPNVGVFNTILQSLGLGALVHNWLGDPNTALYALMFINAPWIASIPKRALSAKTEGGRERVDRQPDHRGKDKHTHKPYQESSYCQVRCGSETEYNGPGEYRWVKQAPAADFTT